MPIEIRISGENAAETIKHVKELASCYTSEIDAASVIPAMSAAIQPPVDNAHVAVGCEKFSEAPSTQEAEKPKATRTRRSKAEIETAAPAISTTPEHRIDPAIAAQDEADEVAETEAAAPAVKTVTHDMIREVLGKYVKTYGMEYAQMDGPATIGRLFGAGKVKVSDIPGDPDSLHLAFSELTKLVEQNPFKREAF